MTVFSSKQVEKALRKKGFRQNNNKHHMFHYYDTLGKKTRIHTETSLNGHEIGDDLIAKMCSQTCLNKKNFIRLINCPLKRDEYEHILKAIGEID